MNITQKGGSATLKFDWLLSQMQMVSLCKPARRSELKTLRLMRGRGALLKQIQQEGTIQVPFLPPHDACLSSS